MAAVLIVSGARLDVRNAKGKTAHDLATEAQLILGSVEGLDYFGTGLGLGVSW